MLHARWLNLNQGLPWTYLLMLVGICSFNAGLPGQDFPGDMTLSKVLMPGKGWQSLQQGFQFTDGACSDEYGNFYFVGKRSEESAIYRINTDDEMEVFIPRAPGVSGLAFGPDGRLYACRWSKNDVIVFEASGDMIVLAEDVHANDLAIHAQGHLFYTAQRGVVWLNPLADWKQTLLSPEPASPNGISLNPDGGMLLVSEYAGQHVWSFAVDPVSGGEHGERYMTMRAPSDRSSCRGDGMTVDSEGRSYVTTALGLQMFDATGRISGIIAIPAAARGMNNVVFAGSRRDHLFITCSQGIFKRQTKAKGFWHFNSKTESR